MQKFERNLKVAMDVMRICSTHLALKLCFISSKNWVQREKKNLCFRLAYLGCCHLNVVYKSQAISFSITLVNTYYLFGGPSERNSRMLEELSQETQLFEHSTIVL